MAAMLMLAICAGVRPRSARIVGINGATANQAKKQTKKAIHVRWKARIGMEVKVRSRRRVARCSMSGAPCGRAERCKGGAREESGGWEVNARIFARRWCMCAIVGHPEWCGLVRVSDDRSCLLTRGIT